MNISAETYQSIQKDVRSCVMVMVFVVPIFSCSRKYFFDNLCDMFQIWRCIDACAPGVVAFPAARGEKESGSELKRGDSQHLKAAKIILGVKFKLQLETKGMINVY